MIFGTQLCKWILIILINLLCCTPCTSLTWWGNVDVIEIMPFATNNILFYSQHFIKILRKEKRYSSRKFIPEFPNKNCSRRDLNHLIKLNMLLPDISSVFGDYVFQQDGAPTLSPCCRERCQSLSLQRCGHPIRQIWIWWTTASGVYSKEGLPFADPSCEGAELLKQRLPREWRLLDDTIITAAIA